MVAEMFREWDSHDLDSVYARLTTDYREYANGVLVKSGREEARAADAVLYDMIPDYRRTVDELWGVDDRVVSRFVTMGPRPTEASSSCRCSASTDCATAESAKPTFTSIPRRLRPSEVRHICRSVEAPLSGRCRRSYSSHMRAGEASYLAVAPPGIPDQRATEPPPRG